MSLFRNLVFISTGTKNFTKDGYLRASKHFDNSIMETSLKGKICAVTGANTGLGFKASEELAKRGCTLLMLCRNEERGQAAVAQVKEATGNQDVHLEVVDISSLASIKSFAQRYSESGRPLHVLVNNAGVMVLDRQTSAEGHDVNFATNTLGTWALTALLGPALTKSAPSKVITVTSGGMYTEHLDVDDFQNEKMKQYDGTKAYAKDKRRQVAMTERFAQLWGDKGVGVYSMHPGWAETDGVRNAMPGFFNTFKNKFRDTYMGVDTVVWLALQEPSKLEAGGLYLDRASQAKHLWLAGTSYKEEQVDAMWGKLAGLAGLDAVTLQLQAQAQ